MGTKFSVIIPIFNAESYLCECIDSILYQTYDNYEIILVNDGSTDNSFEICKDYASTNNKVKVYTKKNRSMIRTGS